MKQVVLRKRKREVAIHDCLTPHDHILAPFAVAVNPQVGQPSYICMELAEKSLFDCLYNSKQANEKQEVPSAKWALQIALGMKHLHDGCVIHRDLKSANVLVFVTGDVKLCDFGCAKSLKVSAKRSKDTGTHRWNPPEMYQSEKINKGCDVFSYGMVVYELFAHHVPFHHVQEDSKIKSLLKEYKRPRIPSSAPQYFQHLMQACWEQYSHDRPDFQAIVCALKDREFNHKIQTDQIPEPKDNVTTPDPYQPPVKQDPVVSRRSSMAVAHVVLS